MEVETNLAASGAFSWRVLNEGGSERTREKVFRAVLDAESRDKDAQALTLANYVFSPLASAAGTVKLRLTPRRTDAQLIDGTLTVGAVAVLLDEIGHSGQALFASGGCVTTKLD
jgi:alpha-D-ribose 1-methylphosphonate 5-triphosphate synthase subunit PhnH